MTELEYDAMHNRLRKADLARGDIYLMRAILDGPGFSKDVPLNVPVNDSQPMTSCSVPFRAPAEWMTEVIREYAEKRLAEAMEELSKL